MVPLLTAVLCVVHQRRKSGATGVGVCAFAPRPTMHSTDRLVPCTDSTRWLFSPIVRVEENSSLQSQLRCGFVTLMMAKQIQDDIPADDTTRDERTDEDEAQRSSTSSSRPSWLERYEDLRKYHSIHGHSDVPHRDNSAGLGSWVMTQRNQYAKLRAGKKSTMNESRIAMLNELDFVWDKLDYIWSQSYDQLVEFKDEHGHCVVPTTRGSLGLWVRDQRREYGKRNRGEKSLLTEERIERLNEVGFVWDVRDWQFQSKLEELRLYKLMNGHINIKSTEGKLGEWVCNRKKEYRKLLEGKQSSMSSERRAALEELGFSPEMLQEKRPRAPNSHVPFGSWFEALQLYKEKNGHCNVPQSEGPLGWWVNRMRYKMKLESQGEETTLQHHHVERLNSIGFVWDMLEWTWNENYKALKQHKDQNGDANVPFSAGELGKWVTEQRMQYKLKQRGEKTRMTDKREKLLNAVGFEWDLGERMQAENDAAWHERLEELRRWKEEHGDFNVPCHHGKLGDWVTQQRFEFRAWMRGEASRLTEERRAALEAIGFVEESRSKSNRQ